MAKSGKRQLPQDEDPEDSSDLSDSDDSQHNEYDRDEGHHHGTPPSEKDLLEVKEKITANASDYEAHLLLISLLQRTDDFDALRLAREDMAKVFPLPEAVWSSWIRDEKRLATTPEEKLKVVALYERAVGDYLSVPIWLEYLSFLIEEYEDAKGGEEGGDGMDVDAAPWITPAVLREAFGKALNAAGFHFLQGNDIWKLMRDFEMSALEAAIATMRKLYLDRLKLPLTGLDEIFSEYSSFETRFDNAHYEELLKSANALVAVARKGVEERDVLERKLTHAGNGIDEFLAYIAYEKIKKSEPLRVRTIYERAVAVHCLDPRLWDAFICDMILLVKPTLMGLVDRALRNCGWSADLWATKLRLQGKFDEPKDIFDETFQKGLLAVSPLASLEESMKLLLARCEYFVRRAGGSLSIANLNQVPRRTRMLRMSELFIRSASTICGLYWGNVMPKLSLI
ncbi:hypothetical protein BDK51DRAFT_35367 [Blyttiomyces helicus]|uniref:Suppressor of forked domain-containing protein n=1 Tax=Blyttiomyces helicus TaxID=388810 RepID=A0A4P9W264_9FUNG|nr:hypothetical protein BDK51DRAFT_35367 [Blyttiomyces helicus]|eukprot:RKO86301.1 hypothetical protein BDK51DRAFT_35367 [Blyttiomyces helicus]